MKMQNLNAPILLFALFLCLGGHYVPTAIADDHPKGNWHLEREDQHSIPFLETDNEGTETAGQIAAWLLLVANLPVALSILIKWINQFMPLGAELKNSLSNFNRFQKKHMMIVHYYLNPAIFGIVVWHYISSRCLSTSLPEWGLFLLVGFMTCGILIKFKLCPKAFRKTVHQLHTQPLIFVALILVLTVGHTIID